jgi:hypothetical protein
VRARGVPGPEPERRGKAQITAIPQTIAAKKLTFGCRQNLSGTYAMLFLIGGIGVSKSRAYVSNPIGVLISDALLSE